MTPKPTRQDMELTTGLASDFDGSITKAPFGVRDEYAEIAGTTDPMLLLEISSPEFDQPVPQAYSLGGKQQWEAQKGGTEVISGVNPNLRGFNMNSRAGTLVNRMYQLVGAGNRDAGKDYFANKGFYMTQSVFYEGENFHWAREKMATVGGDTRDVLMPTIYLGSTKKAAKPGAEAADIPAADIDALVKLADGKTLVEAKTALVRSPELKLKKTLLTAVVQGKLLEKLVEQGKLTEIDGKLIAV